MARYKLQDWEENGYHDSDGMLAVWEHNGRTGWTTSTPAQMKRNTGGRYVAIRDLQDEFGAEVGT